MPFGGPGGGRSFVPPPALCRLARSTGAMPRLRGDQPPDRQSWTPQEAAAGAAFVISVRTAAKVPYAVGTTSHCP